jgi:multimeric flavodoxin WrbA
MKVVAFNGSPRKNGNTHFMIETVFEELRAHGIETKEINVAQKPIHGCMVCGKCRENKDGHCAIKNDSLNEWVDEIKDADAVILGSPVYFADITGQMKSFIDRFSMICRVNGLLCHKVGASVVAYRRAGSVHSFHSMNNVFGVLEMVQVGSSYWNVGMGREEGAVKSDEEGMKTMKNLGQNMAWVLKSIEKAGIEPPKNA